MTEGETHEVVSGDGYAVGNIDALGDGGGFRKIRQALDRLCAFGSVRRLYDVEFQHAERSPHLLAHGGRVVDDQNPLQHSASFATARASCLVITLFTPLGTAAGRRT